MGKYIPNFYNHDKMVWDIFKVTGVITQSEFKELGISPSRTKGYYLDKYTEKIAYKNEQGKRDYYYELTDKGKELGNKEWGLKNYYQTHSALHDLPLAEKYFELRKDETKELVSVLNERETREWMVSTIQDMEDREKAEEYQQKLEDGRISVPDMVYTVIDIETGVEETIGYEITTDNYGKEEIQAKVLCCEILNIKYEERHVK